jgi:long-subunit fatty acid transport protein
MHGFGPVSQAQAGTGVWSDDGFSALWHNPAWLRRVSEQRFFVGWESTQVELDARTPRRSDYELDHAENGTLYGLVAPLFRQAEYGLIFGVGASVPGDLVARARIPYADELQAPLLIDHLDSLNLNFGAAFGTERWSVGVGALVLASLAGTIDVGPGTDGTLATDVRTRLAPTVAPVVGASWSVSERVRLALSGRGALRSDVRFVLRAHDLGSLVLPPIHVAGVAQYDPAQAAFELGVALGPVRLAPALGFKAWSALDGFLYQTVECPASDPECDALPATRVSLSNVWVPRLGVTLPLTIAERGDAELRAGYAFEASPLPDQSGVSNYWDNDRHVVTLGYGIRFGSDANPMRLDLALGRHFLLRRVHFKDERVPRSNPGAPFASVTGSVQTFALALGVGF